jgi:flagellar biosynthesis protein FlhA
MAYDVQNTVMDGTTALSRNTDIMMAAGVVGILLIMMIPLPSMVLDMLLSFNITCSLVILLVGMYIHRPLDLSSFPSILLLVTLFRLSLNIASTRIILLHGSEGPLAAGSVINAFGSFVVGGNYVVGLIVFLILVVINFVVITKGAGRIAEVAARFTLDAMPGKQMSIDADLNAGLINDQEAKTRRSEISREAEYYGAMDGANKFVRGDAIAGILITMVNIIAGLLIGVFQDHMSFSDAAQTYTLLTVGDGLVSQIPALVVSTSAGIIVSRAGSEASLGREISSQLITQPRAIAIAAAVLFVFGVFPGLPTVPFLVLSATAAVIAYYLFQAEKAKRQEEALPAAADEEEPAVSAVKPLPPVDMLALEVGYGLVPLVDIDQNGELLDRIKSIRRQLVREVGIIVPSVHIQDNMQLKPGEYTILLKGNEVARGELMTNYYLAMKPEADDVHEIEGQVTREPTYGLPALWIREKDKDEAVEKGYTVVDNATVLTTHLTDVIRRYAHELVGRQDVQQMLDTLAESHPKAVEELVPNLLPLGGVVKVLQNLLREQIPIRDLLTIVESLADWSPVTKDTDVLTEYVRQALARTLSRLYQSQDGKIVALTLDPELERIIAEAVKPADHGSYLAIEPDFAQKVMSNLAGQLEKFSRLSLQPVILCGARIRSHFKKLADRFIPNLAVLSYNEISSDVTIQSLGMVGRPDAH